MRVAAAIAICSLVCLVLMTARLAAQPVAAPETADDLPRFVSLSATKANLRAGPGKDHPVRWVYRRRHLPLLVIDRYNEWLQVRDWDGEEGWMHKNLLRGPRTLRVMAEFKELFRSPDTGSDLVAVLETGVVANVKACSEGWCQVRVGRVSGWLESTECFGLYREELTR